MKVLILESPEIPGSIPEMYKACVSQIISLELMMCLKLKHMLKWFTELGPESLATFRTEP